VNGIHAALVGRCGQDAEARYTQQGTPLLVVSIAAQDSKAEPGAAAEWVKVSYFGQDAEALAERLTKGSEAYAEGRIRLAQWQGRDGQSHYGLNMTAWKLEVLGAIGKRAQKPAAVTAMPACSP
jgi:single-strand DNA-binding protein